ncbi:hypothetical protein [Methanococcoides alaskense]|uniref:Translation initiation factor IF-1 n=1 Tax=Methanococcoides alaskense TaxID=325778 RepID=A0AA90U178_9EURY|nr:hypothetical protein [Methanococcoides alaskense]MDR6223423.1 translation initiation factor IF-1 [Methanococcoides alaskense]
MHKIPINRDEEPTQRSREVLATIENIPEAKHVKFRYLDENVSMERIPRAMKKFLKG